jgi:hypothetical protein
MARGLLSSKASSDAVLLRFTVTCKIHRQAIGQGRVVFCVSGRLTGDNVNTLRTLLEQERSALTLDLKDVRVVDGEAVKLLASHESNGVTLNNCPRYVREWIRREREATNG